MKITAVIMAGGKGERFWPKSRSSYPKQFLSLTSDGETMIQKTIKRLLPIVDTEDIFIVTNENYVPLINEQLPDIPSENILAEPVARNTAPCIALAAAVISKKYNEDAVMMVLPSDHLIKYDELYTDTMRHAVKVAKNGGEITDEKKAEIMENMNAIDDAQTGGLAEYTRRADAAEAKIN